MDDRRRALPDERIKEAVRLFVNEDMYKMRGGADFPDRKTLLDILNRHNGAWASGDIYRGLSITPGLFYAANDDLTHILSTRGNPSWKDVDMRGNEMTFMFEPLLEAWKTKWSLNQDDGISPFFKRCAFNGWVSSAATEARGNPDNKPIRRTVALYTPEGKPIPKERGRHKVQRSKKFEECKMIVDCVECATGLEGDLHEINVEEVMIANAPRMYDGKDLDLNGIFWEKFQKQLVMRCMFDPLRYRIAHFDFDGKIYAVDDDTQLFNAVVRMRWMASKKKEDREKRRLTGIYLVDVEFEEEEECEE